MLISDSQMNYMDDQNVISGIETEIAAIKSLVTECKKVVQQKEEELKTALADLDIYEEKIKKLEGLRDTYVRKTKYGENFHTFIKVFNINGVTFNMVRAVGSSFFMGTPDSDTDADNDEKPQHLVTLNDFYIGETLVTQTLWKAVMETEPFYFEGENLPADNVSWDDCQEFLKKLNQKTGLVFRLPTEAEWEYAARGGRNNIGYKYAGSNEIDEVAWYNGNSGKETHPVKGKNPNELGIYDMSGNLMEWCQDFYDSDYYKNSPSNNPCKNSYGHDRVLRGGSWLTGNDNSCRVSNRFSDRPDHYSNNYGFRLVLVL